MTRIYFKSQGNSSARGGSSSSSSSSSVGNTGKSKTTSSANSKPSSNNNLQSNQRQKPSVSPPVLKENAPDTSTDKLDPSAIEQIADGLEKMVLSWTSHPHKNTHLVDRHLENAHLGYAVENAHTSLLSSDTIKSATMEVHEDGEFSIGTKETTISFIHQRHPQQRLIHHHQTHNQKTVIVDGMGDTVQDFMRGDVIRNSVISIQPNGECDVIDYPVGNAMSQPSAVWYLSPRLALPNTVNLSRNHSPVHAICGNAQEDDVDDAVDIQEIQQTQPTDGQWDLSKQDVISEEGPRTHESSSTTSEKISCKLEIGDTKTWSEVVEINGGNKIKDLLGKKLAALGTDSPSSQGSEKMDADYYKKKVEELQIALLECAMEYEVKIVEMKMQALQTKTTERRTELAEKVAEKPEVIEKPSSGDHVKDKRDAHRVEYLKKQLSRLQNEKAATARELSDLKKRERQFDLQRRSLDDALSRVNFLQSEVAKKEQDIVDCRLREKEAKAQLYELQLGLQKAQASQIEPRKLLTLLPALKDWIQCTRKGQYDSRGNGDKPDHIPPIDNIVCAITKEIQTLQTALTQIMSKG